MSYYELKKKFGNDTDIINHLIGENEIYKEALYNIIGTTKIKKACEELFPDRNFTTPAYISCIYEAEMAFNKLKGG